MQYVIFDDYRYTYGGRTFVMREFAMPSRGVHGMLLPSQNVEDFGAALIARGAIGYVKNSTLYPHLTVRENLRIFALMDGLDPESVLELGRSLGIDMENKRRFDFVDSKTRYLALFVQAVVRKGSIYVFYADRLSGALVTEEAWTILKRLGESSAVLVVGENRESLTRCDDILNDVSGEVEHA